MNENIDPEQSQSYEVKTLLAWHAPGRPFREHGFEYFFNGFLIMIAIEIILFLFSQYLLMLVVLSLVFLSFSLALVPPRDFYYRISSEGIRVEDHFFIWDELYDFYFMRQHGQETLHIRTKTFYPGEVIVSLGSIDPRQVKEVLINFLPFREYVRPTFMERAGDWLEKNFPLERSIS